MSKKGFTLAEVLITLAIIGIVAALTIPSVISNYQQQEFKTGLKKAVSVLNEAIQTNIAVDGETPYENSNLFSYLKRHMSVIKSINGTDSAYSWNLVFYTTDGMRFEFIPNQSSRVNSNLKLYESGIDIYGARVTSTINQGGIEYPASYTPISMYCGSYGLNKNPNNTLFPPCIVSVDVNGDKKPNPKSVANYVDEINANGNFIPGHWANTIEYTYSSPTDRKLSDIFTIMITDEKAIPFGVVAQRAMYSK